MDGKVLSYNPDRCFGFIQPLIGKPGTVEKVFFHRSGLDHGLNGLPIGARVRFKLTDGMDGRPQAACIQLVEASVKRLFKADQSEQERIPDREWLDLST